MVLSSARGPRIVKTIICNFFVVVADCCPETQNGASCKGSLECVVVNIFFQAHIPLINLVRSVITGKSQTEALVLFPCNDRTDEVNKLFIMWPFFWLRFGLFFGLWIIKLALAVVLFYLYARFSFSY